MAGSVVKFCERIETKTKQFTGSGIVVGIEGRLKPDSVFLEECLSERLLEFHYIHEKMLIYSVLEIKRNFKLCFKDFELFFFAC